MTLIYIIFFHNRWNTYVVDGHDVEALCKAFHDATMVKDKPTAIVAKTFKGKGIPGKTTLEAMLLFLFIYQLETWSVSSF